MEYIWSNRGGEEISVASISQHWAVLQGALSNLGEKKQFLLDIHFNYL